MIRQQCNIIKNLLNQIPIINKLTAQSLYKRLPLALISLNPKIVDMLEYKWGGHDDMFHSVKATVKKFSKFSDLDIRKLEDQAMDAINRTLSEIYACHHCGTDLRKCGVIRTTSGNEVVELYISEDGRQARTHHEKFHGSSNIRYNCLSCRDGINSSVGVHDFLRRGINQNVCIEYLHKYYPRIMSNKKSKQENAIPKYGDNPFQDVPIPESAQGLRRGSGGSGGMSVGADATIERSQEQLERMRLEMRIDEDASNG